MSEVAHLKTHFQNLGLPEAASNWLLEVWGAIQFFDDVADGDEVSRKDLNSVLWSVFVSMHSNPFFDENRGAIIPVLAVQILKWQASDKAEREGRADARSYVWRAGYYDLVLAVVAIVHGPAKATEISESVMGMYGDTFEQYKQEFA